MFMWFVGPLGYGFLHKARRSWPGLHELIEIDEAAPGRSFGISIVEPRGPKYQNI